MLGLDPSRFVNLAIALIVAATLHEFAHAYVADRLGDPTPRALGRLTLNPLAHLDLVGTVLILLAGFGWAKPVPINPSNFSNWRRDTIMVAMAGPLANLTLLFLFGLPIKLGLLDGEIPLGRLLFTCVYINAMLAVFNLIPVPPLDGSKVLVGLLPPQLAISYARVEPFGVIILFALIFTRLLGAIVIPPMQWLIMQATGSPMFGLF